MISHVRWEDTEYILTICIWLHYNASSIYDGKLRLNVYFPSLGLKDAIFKGKYWKTHLLILEQSNFSHLYKHIIFSSSQTTIGRENIRIYIL